MVKQIYADLCKNLNISVELPITDDISREEIPENKNGDTAVSTLSIQIFFDISLM